MKARRHKMAKSTTTPRRTRTTSKPTTVKASPTPPTTPDPVVVEENRPDVAAPAMRKKELVDAVVSRSGVKPRYVKPAVEAVLSEIGAAIAEGRDLNLPGLGKVKVQRHKNLANGDVYVTRIRQPKPRPAAPGAGPDADPKDPLAEAAE